MSITSIVLKLAGCTRRQHPAFTILIPLFFAWAMYAAAQTRDEPLPITLGETQTFILSGQGATYFAYESPGDEVITLIARGLGCDAENSCGVDIDVDESVMQDTVLEVLNPKGRRLAYNDDHHTDRPELLDSDSVIDTLLLPEPGLYLIRVNTYGGIFDSEVELTLEQADLFDTETSVEAGITTITGVLPAHQRYTYNFEASEGDSVTITARDVAHQIDPRLLLLDVDDQIIAENDDHNSDDLTLDVFDARITIEIPEDGDYTLILVEFMGRAGQFEITIEKQRQT